MTWVFWVRACDQADELARGFGWGSVFKYTFELDSPYIDVSELATHACSMAVLFMKFA